LEACFDTGTFGASFILSACEDDDDDDEDDAEEEEEKTGSNSTKFVREAERGMSSHKSEEKFNGDSRAEKKKKKARNSIK
jgi:hypothetical protein